MAVLWFTDERCQKPELAGNKAAFLARLVKGGYRVPEGFCITADAWMTPSLVEASWESEVKKVLPQLSGPWVVRSSSTAEDSGNLSFAGLFKTVIGLTSADKVIEAIKMIVDRKDMETLRRYAKHHGVTSEDIGMAVIVQTLVKASCSGVAFSRHPVTHERKVVIETNYGLGDVLVEGSIRPDIIEVAEDGRVDVVYIGTKKIKSVFISNQLTRVDTPEVDRKRLAISQDTARNLAALVRQIENDFGVPQDVEWAMTSDTLYVLQARPITTLKDST